MSTASTEDRQPPAIRERRVVSGSALVSASMAQDRVSPESVTALLNDWRAGAPESGERLLREVYRTLRNIASFHLRGERAGHTLEPTALVHEAYLRLLGQQQIDWRDRAHFFGLASVTMRRVLVDHARRRLARKRSAGAESPSITIATNGGPDIDLLDLDRALKAFAELFPRQAKVVEMRYFAGLEFAEVAQCLEISEATAKRDWQFARVWLRDALQPKK
jgi:RNA polymerase sigma-70 factor, ECF subfamily